MDAIIDENKKSWLQRFILWREKKIKEKHFILILSFLAGIFTALAAWFLKFLVMLRSKVYFVSLMSDRSP